MAAWETPTVTGETESGDRISQLSEKAKTRDENRKNSIENHSSTVNDATIAGPSTASDDGGITYPGGFTMLMIMLALCLAIFCVALDQTIIGTATPRITDEFHSLQDVGWYGSAYLLDLCAFQLFYGKLYSLFGNKLVFLAALLLFEVGSAVCGAAPSSTALIIGRAIAGLGAAGIYSGCFVIVANTSPVEKRPVYSGILGLTYGLASVLGPLIGGAFTDNVTWRWCFYVNLPIGGATAAIILLFFRLPPRPGAKQSLGVLQMFWLLDPIGTLLFVPSIVCLLLALQWGGTTYSWSNGRIIALLVVFAVSLIAFIGVQIWLGKTATVPPSVASQRSIAFGSLFGLFLGAAFFTFTYFIPIWFQAIEGVSPLLSGVHTIPLVLTMTVAIMFSGAFTTKFGYYMPYIYASVVLTSIGSGLITTWTPDTSAGVWVGYQIIFGVGAGLAFQLPQIAAQTVLQIEDVPIGIAITFFCEVFGGAVFVSVGNNVLNSKLVQYIGELDIPKVDPLTIVHNGATQLRAYVPADHLTEAITAYNAALTKTFQVALICSCLSALGAVGMEWRSVKFPAAAAAAAAA